jgi:leucyl aminopeptidase
MSVKIYYSNKVPKKSSSNLVLFVDDKFNITNLKKYLSSAELSYINDLLKINDLKKNMFLFEINSKKKIMLISIKKDLKISDVENLGAEFYGRINHGKNIEYSVNTETVIGKQESFIGYFLHGLKLKSYSFNKYKTKKVKRFISINVQGNKNKPSNQTQLKFKSLEEGTFYARDLVSEPGNILHPDEYAKRLIDLKKDGLKINIYDEKKLKKMGMNALLGVGMGSIRGSYLVTMEWNNAKNNSKPLAFVGKGVTFDTGGYSLKPARFMEDMTYDMAGSAAVAAAEPAIS